MKYIIWILYVFFFFRYGKERYGKIFPAVSELGANISREEEFSISVQKVKNGSFVVQRKRGYQKKKKKKNGMLSSVDFVPMGEHNRGTRAHILKVLADAVCNQVGILSNFRTFEFHLLEPEAHRKICFSACQFPAQWPTFATYRRILLWLDPLRYSKNAIDRGNVSSRKVRFLLNEIFPKYLSKRLKISNVFDIWGEIRRWEFKKQKYFLFYQILFMI